MSSRTKSLVSLLLVLVLSFCNLSACFASDYDTIPLNSVYQIGTFSYTDYCTSGWKIVEGRYLTLYVAFYKPTWDAGIGEIKLTVTIRDAYTEALIYEYIAGPTNGTTIVSDTKYNIDMGYAGRTIKLTLDASSVGPSNGNWRSMTMYLMTFYTHN